MTVYGKNAALELAEMIVRAIPVFGPPVTEAENQETILALAKAMAPVLSKYVSEPPKWTREPPMKPGWYWVRRTERFIWGGVWSPECVYFGGRSDGVIMLNGRLYSTHDVSAWCGPIEAPPVPEGM